MRMGGKKMIENYIKAIYDSKRKDLIEKIEEQFYNHPKMLPYDQITLNCAIKAIQSNLANIEYIRKELQDEEEFIQEFITSYNKLKRAPRYLDELFELSYSNIRFDNKRKYVLSEDIKLYLSLNK